jgi:tripartite ATP-independent transporter DctP family solute receptor
MREIYKFIFAGSLLLLVSCSGNKQEAKPESKAKLVFRLANELKPDSRIWEASNLFKEELEKAAPELGIEEGEIQVQFFDQGSIGTERQLLESCYFGVIEMVQVNSSVVTTLDPRFSILDLPYLIVSEEQLKEVLYGEIGKEFLDGLTSFRLLGLGFYGNGFRSLFFKQNPPKQIAAPADFRGLKIRVMESPVMIGSINAIGATATPIPFSELFQSIKTGVVDGAENSARIFMSYKYYEAGCNQFVLTDHFATQHVIVTNNEWFNSLEKKYRQRIQEAIKISQPKFDRIWEQSTEESLAEMKAEGVNVVAIEDKTPFVSQANTIISDFERKNSPEIQALINKIRQLRNKYISIEQNEHLK